MDIWSRVIICALAVVIIILILKINIMRKAAKEIEDALADRLATDTNTLIDISSSDRHMRSLANSINTQLRKLRQERHRFEQGDMELKNAITNISHDLRTPLTAIYGYLDLLKVENKPEEMERYLAIIRNRVELLAQLTEELFRYSIIISTESNDVCEPIVVNRVLEESIASFYTDLNEHDITPDIKMTETRVVRMIDANALARVFSNLLNNAIKYSDGDLDIALSETGEITFANTASGLDEIEVGRLFDRFYTVEAARKSTGLGLTIARTLIEQMKGSISAQYENDRLVITIRLPDDPDHQTRVTQ